MSLVKNIVGKKINKEQSGELHPLTYVERSNLRRKKLFTALLLLTVINAAVITYIEFFKENPETKSHKVQIPPVKEEKKEKVAKKQEKNQENLPPGKPLEKKAEKSKTTINSNFSLEDVKKEVSKLQFEESIPPLNIKRETPKPSVSEFDELYEKAKKYEEKGDYISAIYYYRKAYKLHPDEFILYKLGLLHYRIKRYQGASKYAKKVIETTNNPQLLDRAYYLLYKSYEKLGQKNKAKLILEEAYYKLPQGFLVSKALAKLYMKEGNLYAAAEIFETLADKDLESAILAGKAYEKLGETQLAIDMYKKALKITDGKYKKWLEDKIKLLTQKL